MPTASAPYQLKLPGIFALSLLFIILLSVRSLYADAPTIFDAKERIDEVNAKMGQGGQRPTPPNSLPYQDGNNPLIIPIKMAADLVKHTTDFYTGYADWSIIGMCIRCGHFGCSFYPYQEYYYPFEMAEITGLFQGQYTPDLLMSLYEDFQESEGYDLTHQINPYDISRAKSVIGMDPSIPDKSIITPDDVKKLPKELRLRGGLDNLPSSMERQSTFFTPLSQMIGFPQAFLGNCHDTPAPMPIGLNRTDSPLFRVFASHPSFSELLFPEEAIRTRLDPAVCLGHNIYEEVTPALPFSFIRPGTKNRHLCLKLLGAHYPPTTRMADVRNFDVAAQNAFLRGDHLFRQLIQAKVDYAYYKSSAISRHKQDYVQWNYPSRFPSGKRQLGTFGDFREDNYNPSPDPQDPYRAVSTTWKYIRCCPRRYKVLIGPKPQLKGLNEFKEEKDY